VRWLEKLGSKYQQRKEGNYVDRHKEPETIEYQKAFIQQYLTNYTKDNGINMVENHVDRCHLFQDRMNKETKFGGGLSMCKDSQEKALIMFGHDECIFKQFTMSTKSWIGPNGETMPVPKDVRQGTMISAFQLREFGFSLDLTPDLLQEVNFTRQRKSYEDSKAAIIKRGYTAKQPLTSTPFIIEFKYGANNDEY
jgi:hypothetical protein